jgi:acyl-CoA reductase-like NAD-dependent aldehyde dehydrogenase
MLRAGNALRFTPDEIEEFRKLGLDFDGARTQDDIEQALDRWADTLNDERPDLLEKIAAAMAKAKGSRYPRA